MESLLQSIQQATLHADRLGSIGPLQALHDQLAAPAAQKELKRVSDKVEQALLHLDPRKHCLGWIHLLHAKLSSKKLPNSFLNHALTLLEKGQAEQILIAPSFVCKIVEGLHGMPEARTNPQDALLPLRRACRVISQDHPHRITPLHSFFLESCYLSQHFHASQSILSVPKYAVAPPSTHGTSTLHVLRYYYFAGVLSCGLKQWSQACDYFAQCLSVPTNQCVSIFQLQAFKKLNLCSILATGTLFRLPESALLLEKAIRPQVETYDFLARVFGTGQLWAIDHALTLTEKVLLKDDNSGLAKLARVSVIQRNMTKISETFVTLSLDQLTHNAGLSGPHAAEALVIQLVSEGYISARIDRINKVITFEDSVESFQSLRATQLLHDKVREVMDLNQILKGMDLELRSSSTNFVSSISDSQPSQPQPMTSALSEEERQLESALAASEHHQ